MAEECTNQNGHGDGNEDVDDGATRDPDLTMAHECINRAAGPRCCATYSDQRHPLSGREKLSHRF